MQTPVGGLLNKKGKCANCGKAIVITPSNTSQTCRLCRSSLAEKAADTIFSQVNKESDENEYKNSYQIKLIPIDEYLEDETTVKIMIRNGYRLKAVNSEFMFFHKH